MTEKYTGPDTPVRLYTIETLVESVKQAKTKLADFQVSLITNMDPYNVVSFIRCELFILIDQILCFRYFPKEGTQGSPKKMTEEQQIVCVEFLEEFLLFGLMYLNHQNQLMPILVEWSSMKKPNLFLVNPVLAYLSCGDELIESLVKLFGRDQRSQRFYEAHSFSLCVQAQELELKATSMQAKLIQVINFVASFIIKGGSERIIDLLETK